MSIQEANLKAIADAIREKEGSAEPIPAGDFAERIRAMRIGGDVSFTISITAPPNKVSYNTGSLFDPAGMSVWAEFSNGYGLYVNHADLVFDPAGPLEEGTQSVTVSFSWGGAAVPFHAINERVFHANRLFRLRRLPAPGEGHRHTLGPDRKSTRLNSSH